MKKSVKKNSKRIKKNQILLGKMKYCSWDEPLFNCEKNIKETSDSKEYINNYFTFRNENNKVYEYNVFEVNLSVCNGLDNAVKIGEHILNNEDRKFTHISKVAHRILKELYVNTRRVMNITYKDFIAAPNGHYITSENIQMLYNSVCR